MQSKCLFRVKFSLRIAKYTHFVYNKCSCNKGIDVVEFNRKNANREDTQTKSVRYGRY